MRVSEIFYSLQGEGRWTGTPAIFVRLSGCNLSCDFCDTDHGRGREMTEVDIVKTVNEYSARHVVITGGEPTLQLTASLVRQLHDSHKFVQIETNGTCRLSDELLEEIDWITCSPKYGKIPVIQRIDELKVVYDLDRVEDIERLGEIFIATGEYHLQPCDRKDAGYNEKNTASCIKYILDNPKWTLSLQTHKILNIQ